MASGSASASAKPGRKIKQTYHHGDLRRALLDAALQRVRERGLSALTLRELARQVGVTHAAPYHHFPTREVLLDTLAYEAFSALDVATARALTGIADPSERLSAAGRAYVDFARSQPESLQIMFRRRPPAATPASTELQDASARVYAHLFDAVVACQASGVAPAGDPHQLALVAWSMVHGFAKLWVEGPLENMPSYAGHYEQLRDKLVMSLTEAWERGR